MLAQLDGIGTLEQDRAVDEIGWRFGPSLTYLNTQGNPAIAKPVLDAFREMTAGRVVWERDNRLWRWRQDYDVAGSRIG